VKRLWVVEQSSYNAIRLVKKKKMISTR
jgi:hypothetical protein